MRKFLKSLITLLGNAQARKNYNHPSEQPYRVFRSHRRNKDSDRKIEHLMYGGDCEQVRKLTTSKKEISNSVLHKKAIIKVKFHNNKINRIGLHNIRVNKMMRK